MVEIFAGISIVIASGFIGLLIRDYIANMFNARSNEIEEDAFCEIDINHMLMYSKKSERKDVGELKRKIEEFKNRNKFYKM
ncbi:hypothetical protein [uncultured Maribacter sp.]|uniref:hypothetical protein n=1 Tax=uncultured Maribacter sp. TaxID=431308 RepID=UPI0030EF2895|tara:strand:+ start:57492 stop:57734 length:243 start_codon:yes stop_codon:yes gene_type:complete